MKKSIILILALLIFSGCSKSENVNNDNVVETNQNTQETVVESITEESNEETIVESSDDSEQNDSQDTSEETQEIIETESETEVEIVSETIEDTLEETQVNETSSETSNDDSKNNTFVGTVRKMKAAEIIDQFGFSRFEKSEYNSLPDYYMLEHVEPVGIPFKEGFRDAYYTYIEINFPGDTLYIENLNNLVDKKVKVKVEDLNLIQDPTMPAETYFLYNPTFEVIE